MLNVCSKNDPKFAREPFEQHSAMVLKLDDVAEFRANFEDKATNIRAIAEALNLGLDAFVFIDDSPVECALVRETLPEVWTIELNGSFRISRFVRTCRAVPGWPTYRGRSPSHRKLQGAGNRSKRHGIGDRYRQFPA